MSNTSQDLTVGSLPKKMLLFSIPLMLSNLLQVLFNMSDIAVVGRFSGAAALGSVGSTSMLVTLITGLFIGLGNGINVIAAKYLGARQQDNLRESVHTAFLISLISGIALFAVTFLITPLVLRLLKTRSELLDGAILYLRIYVTGCPALALYNFGNAVFSAAGNTKKPLIIMLLAGMLNVALNIAFVVGAGLGVAGVAIASSVSQYFSAFLILFFLFRTKEAYRLTLSEMRLSRDKAEMVIKMGVPAGLQNAIFAGANLFIQAGVNSLSTVMVEGNAAAANADGLVFDVMAAFYTAVASFIGQSFGAGNRDRVIKSYFTGLAYSFGVGMLMGVSLAVFGRSFLSVFTSEPEVIEAGMTRLTIMGVCYGFSAFMDCTIAASRGLGSTIIPTFIVILGSCVFRILWVYTVFAYFHTTTSLYMLYIFSWLITAVAEIIHFKKLYKTVFSQPIAAHS